MNIYLWRSRDQEAVLNYVLVRILDGIKHNLVCTVAYRTLINIPGNVPDFKLWHEWLLTVGKVMLVERITNFVEFLF